MKQQCLEIVRRTKSGDVIKTFRCRSGRVSVFRSQNDELHRLYTDALSGNQTEERFSLLLNEKEFIPREHILIGFDLKNELTSDLTVGQFLQIHGMEEKEIEPLLSQFGLGGLSQTNIQKLSDNQKHAVLLLYATNQTASVVVMKDPFQAIEDNWRDAYAKRIVDFVWEQQGMVLITNLSWRPDSWIDNDLIARIQIDHTVRRATIGIGGENMLTDMAKKLRQNFSSESKKEVQPVRIASTKIIIEEQQKEPHPTPLSQKAHFDKRLALLAGSLAVALVGSLAYITLPDRYDPQKSVTVLAKTESSPLRDEETVPLNGNTEQTQQEYKAIKQELPPRKPIKKQPKQYAYVLDAYPKDIQHSIRKAYRGEINLASVKSFDTPKSERVQFQRTHQTTQNNELSRHSWSEPELQSQRSNAEHARREAIANKSKIFEKLLELRARGAR